MNRDITDPQQAHEAFRRAVEQLQIVTESMAAPVTRCSRDFTYVWVSKPYAEWIGRPADQITGRPIVEIIGKDAFEQLRPHFEQVLAGQVVRYEEQVSFRGIGPRWIVATYTPTFDASGACDGWVAAVVDIDDRKRMERELLHLNETLRETDRRKDEFLAILGHELRNPLAAISTAVGVLGIPKVSAASSARARTVIQRQTQQLTRIVDDLLDLGRLAAGKITLHRAPVDFGEIAERCIASFAERQTHSIVTSIERAPVSGDATRLEQIVTNLVSNAVRYTAQGGLIRARVSVEASQAVLEIEDSGSGIPPELLPRLFEMFSQGERPAERPGGGLGIGLALVRRLAELHGGTVEAHSRGIGYGSRFVVRLPAIEAARTADETSPVAGARQRARILVIEDNPDVGEMLRDLLEAEGHEVRLATDGASGLEAALQLRPSIALIDIGVPALDGYEVARRLRGRVGTAMRLIALTGYGQPQDRARSKAAGFDTHLVKPVESRQLLRIIDEAAGRQPPRPERRRRKA